MEISIDLQSISGEAGPSLEYYRAATAAIDQVVDHTLQDGISRGEIEHVSLFSFARLPLLVYLGAKLDDDHQLDIYQRHRGTDNWHWPEGEDFTPVQFSFTIPRPQKNQTEAVLIANISGTIHPREIPAQIASLPVFKLFPSQATPVPEIIKSRASLKSFEAMFRRFLGELEVHHKNIRRLHLLGALPISPAVVIGRVRDPATHPSIVTYDRLETGGYKSAIEVR
ncbi:SAVED domain-containing protein [Streptomyces sp. CA-249302]|uniref:SAVED domain-containing protein n=1 Tax=Streptomyces sp. CA-249302 TaxID=3240058 RepID=UPI003D8A8A4C